ncbi:hypothetical protein BC940DRAFT_245810, partial [Gongronella butleri]
LDLAQFQASVVNEVRSEFKTQQLDQQLQAHARISKLTPDVETLLDRMTKETDVLATLARCQANQNAKERELWAQRQALKKEHDGVLASIHAREALGAKLPAEKRQAEQDARDALVRMDRLVLREMDGQVRKVQEALAKVRVPGFYVTKDPAQIKLQRQILARLQQNA